MSDYKHTLNLPDTKFPMRANLIKYEPIILKRWYQQDLYGTIRTVKKGKKMFILHDGPPYANGDIHIGHSVNKILKDIIIKSKGLAGFDSPYIPGWDCHGLPIELKVEQLYGKPGKNLSALEFRKKCREYAYKQVLGQKKDFIRLGVFGDWNHPYLTMDFKTEANIIRTLGKIINNGHLLKGIKPVHWCIDCRSSLADAEIEYYNKISLSIDVAFHAVNTVLVASKFGIYSFINSISIIIWSTTPWTLPDNRAISLNPDFTYQLLQAHTQYFILATDLVESVMKRIGVDKWIILGSCKGTDLESLRFYHPFMDFDVPIILSDHVMLDVGTGAVHTAGGHGQDDFIISQKYDLEISNLLGPDGCYLIGTHPLLDRKCIFEANDLILHLLRKSNVLLSVKNIEHSYPCCWRHKTPIIFRVTLQWFISMDLKGLRQEVLENVKDVRWIPDWSKERNNFMITNRPDWCISRQRTWGVPMSLFIHKDTKQIHPHSVELIEKVAKYVEKDGIQAWWDLNITNFLGEDAINYIKISDTLDVWFDAGSTHISVMNVRPEFYEKSADMYLEGSDQHRGWFMSSLIISSAIKNKAPYKEVITHGFTVDSQGRKMSKSIGNTINPQQVIQKFGSDILRLWVASTDYSCDITISDEILKSTTHVYRRIRNTVRFLLANLKGFDPSADCINIENMLILDRWAIGCALTSQECIIQAYANYNFHEVVKCLMKFCSIEMGSFYLDIIKDRQYTTKKNGVARRSCQTALFYIIEALVRWISPIISFTADEIWSFLPGNRSTYVFTEEWYGNLSKLPNNEKMNNNFWNQLLKIRNEVNKSLEKARIEKRFGNSLEVSVILYVDTQLFNILKSLENELKFVLLTSSAHVKSLESAPKNIQVTESVKTLKIVLDAATGKKCPRCWHYVEDTKWFGEHQKYKELCRRCITNIFGDGEKRRYV
ncbi:Isoleucine--tRNA ligase [Candidatus Ecksteinia adelgidicola]|nr:Isoleucine--tRNA ligase [Candidatus Ecksteinia adelgidicola]